MTTASHVLRRVDAADLRRTPRDPVPAEILEQAREIVTKVRAGGEVVLRRYATQFDGLAEDAPMIHTAAELESAFDALDDEAQGVLRRTAERIDDFARWQREALRDVEVHAHGMRMGHRVIPVATAGCYAPGGRFPLPSTVMMTAVTARAAGVPHVLVCSPNPQPVTLAAAHVAGADGLLAIGGAHAIAAMAFGTETVPACDVIVGPGNAWVTAGKQLVAGRVRIDSLAGPSELLVVADASTDPARAAADLLGQAEHDVMAVPALIALDDGVIESIETEIETQLADLPTAEIATAALENGYAVRATDADDALELCDVIAPEHLQWMAAGTETALERLKNYGGLFLGDDAAEVLGDYGAGPNHVLPTGGSARAKGGLNVYDFVKVNTFMQADDGADVDRVAADSAALARMEGLAAHERAATLRRRGLGRG
ncbi:MAG TPA: histidinol dehydrogenase [Candidatus Krumholzibacteria bacterium]|nr:histidinol dehydrogenase [Candidatus Krumholzibacteria bacterium]